MVSGEHASGWRTSWAAGRRRSFEAILAAARAVCAGTFRGKRSAGLSLRGLGLLGGAKNPDRLRYQTSSCPVPPLVAMIVSQAGSRDYTLGLRHEHVLHELSVEPVAYLCLGHPRACRTRKPDVRRNTLGRRRSLESLLHRCLARS